MYHSVLCVNKQRWKTSYQRWEGGTPHDAAWEDVQEFGREFLTFNLRNKVALNGEGAVTCTEQNQITARKESEQNNKTCNMPNQELVMNERHMQ
ncbi:hypothetical protein VNO77_06973 [Canavalia gladiata]|uniref:Uncharacterized protein n=1 Tax=Canavalia gladiata TaxID=3824 RepID=A0AAN9M7Y7_CANGL